MMKMGKTRKEMRRHNKILGTRDNMLMKPCQSQEMTKQAIQHPKAYDTLIKKNNCYIIYGIHVMIWQKFFHSSSSSSYLILYNWEQIQRVDLTTLALSQLTYCYLEMLYLPPLGTLGTFLSCHGPFILQKTRHG